MGHHHHQTASNWVLLEQHLWVACMVNDRGTRNEWWGMLSNLDIEGPRPAVIKMFFGQVRVPAETLL